MTAPQAIVIGASAGAVEALTTLLSGFEEDFTIPVIIVIHLPPDKKSVIAELMQEYCVLRVCEVEDKERIEPGSVYFAPPDYHLLIEDDRSFSLTVEEPVLYSRPSIDVLFESAADIYGDALIGIILTGANSDGAKGLKTVEEAGGVTIVQNPLTAQAKVMPEAALKECPGATIMDLQQISTYLQKGLAS